MSRRAATIAAPEAPNVADKAKVLIDAQAHRVAKVAAAQAGVTLEAWLNAAIAEKVTRHQEEMR